LLILWFNFTFGLGPYADRTAINLLPGFLFVSPSVINFLTGIQIDSMDGLFWSLYVEVCFYVVFASAYFTVGAKKSIWLIFSLFVLTYVLNVCAYLGLGGPVFGKIAAGLNWLGFLDFGWFTCGALFYRFYVSTERSTLIYGIALGLLSVFTTGMFRYDLGDRLALLIALFVFVGAMHTTVQPMLNTKLLVFLGSISYPLYLLHNTVPIGIVGWLGKTFPEFPAVILPLFPLAVASGLAWVIARFVEPSVSFFVFRWIK
jgi:peptidoglycan/LPS O-acetylase OafA/YrhL